MEEADSKSEILIIPGMFSPAWVWIPFRRYLSDYFPSVSVWDHPHIFQNPEGVAELLSETVLEFKRLGREVLLVSHSYGDWIARRAICTHGAEPACLISLCPVLTAVPLARLARLLRVDIIPELRLLADAERSAEHCLIPDTIHRAILWASFELVVGKPESLERRLETISLLATHNSVIFQPGVWKTVRNELAIVVEKSKR